MRFYRLSDLNAAHGGLIHVAQGLPGNQLDTIGKAQRVDTGVDVGNHVVFVLIQPTGQVVEIVVATKLAHHPLDTSTLFNLHLDPRHRRFGRDFDVLQKQVGIGAGQAFNRNASHANLLH